MDMVGNLNSSLTEQKFTIPKIDNSSSSDMTISLNTAIVNAVNSSLVSVNTPILEPGVTPASPSIPAMPVTIAALSTATVSAGSFNLAFSIANPTAGLVATITSITLTGSSGNVIAQTTTPVSAIAGTATLPLAGKTLEKNMSFAFVCAMSGGTAGKTDTLRITPQLSSDCAISAGTGISVSTTIAIPSSTVPVASDATFVKAEIGTGNLTITHNLPDMPGFTRTLGLTTSGGLTYSGSQALITALPTNPATVFNLAGSNIASGNITVGGNIVVSATAGSFSNMPATGYPVHLTTATKIDLFTSVVVKPGASFITEQNLTQTLQADLKSFVDSITFNQIGVKVAFTNTLPAGNDMTMNVTSTTLAINGSAKPLPSNANTPVTFLNTSNYVLHPKTTSAIDMKMVVTPKAYNTTTKEMTLYNITAGSTLSFSGTVTFVSDWTSATILPGTPLTGIIPDAKGLDLSSIKQYLGDGLEFKQIPVYLYITGPTLAAGSMTFTSTINSTYTPSGTTVKTTKSLLQNPNIPLAANLPPFPAATSPTPNVFDKPLPTPSATMDFAPPFNTKASDLVINYNLAPNSLTLTPADLEHGSSLKAEMVIILPFNMKANAGAAITFSDKPFDGATDLFNRSKNASADDSANILLDSLSSMSLIIKLNNTTGLKGSAVLTDKAGPTDADYFEKSFSLDMPDQTLTLTKGDLAYIRRNNPFAPKVMFTIPAGDFSLKQSGGLEMSLIISASSNIDHTFNLGGN